MNGCTFVKYKSPAEAKDILLSFEAQDSLAYDQNYAWLEAYWSSQRLAIAVRKLMGKKTFVIVGFKEKNPIIVAPMLAKDDKAEILGSGAPMDVQDLWIGKDCNKDCIIQFLTFLKSLGIRRFSAEAVLPNGTSARLFDQIENACIQEQAHNDPIVSLDRFPNSTAWEKSLSPKFKQNVRYYLNRLAKDGKHHEFRCYEAPVAKCLIREAELAHRKRVREITSKNKKLSISLFERLFRSGKYDTTIRRYLANSGVGKLYTMHIDGKLAACIIGLYDQKQEFFQIPFLSHVSGFGKYSPGILLSRFMIRSELDLHHHIDFMLGDEKYKFDLLAENHYYSKIVWED